MGHIKPNITGIDFVIKNIKRAFPLKKEMLFFHIQLMISLLSYYDTSNMKNSICC